MTSCHAPIRPPSPWALLAALTALVILPAKALSAAASPWAINDQSRVRLITPYELAPTAGELRLGLHFRLAPGWHVYWKNSGDAGYPPAVSLTAVPPLGEPALLWPAPERFHLPGDLVAFGYEEEVVYPIRARLEAGDARILQIRAEVDYLVCEIDCIPYRYELALEQPLGEETRPDPETAPLLEAWWQRVPLSVAEVPGIGRTSSLLLPEGEEPRWILELAGVEPDPQTAELFLEAHELFDAGRPVVEETSRGLRFTVPLAWREVGKIPPPETAFAWTVTGVATAAGPLALEGREMVSATTVASKATTTSDLSSILLGALFGGLLLNFMPTVLILLLVQLLEVRPRFEEPPARIRSWALAVVSGTLAGCLGLAVAALVARHAGRAAVWGAQFQEPALVAVMLLITVVLALNLWRLMRVPLPAGQGSGGEEEGGQGQLRGLLVGLYIPLLALAWTVPHLGPAASGALRHGAAATLAAGVTMGLGLALPYLGLALAPRLLRILPRIGGGMTREALGFVAAGAAVWLLYILSGQMASAGLAFVELAVLSVGLFAWLRSQVARGKIIGGILGAGLLLASLAVPWLAHQGRLRTTGAGPEGTIPVAGERSSVPVELPRVQ